MKRIQDIIALVFIVGLGIVSILSVFNIWGIISGDAVSKTIDTIVVLFVFASIISFALRFVDSRESNTGIVEAVNPIFLNLRHGVVAGFVVIASTLAFLGVMSIWDVVTHEVLFKALSSLGVIAFASFVAVLVCLEREKKEFMANKVSMVAVVASMIIFLLIVGSIR